VTRLTEVGVAPTEPLRNGTAKFALEFYKVSSVLWTILDTSTDTNGRALTADEIFWLVLLALLLGLNAIFETSEIR
jgi:hypothetical protein